MRRFERDWKLLVASRTWLGERGLRLIDSRGPEGMDQGYDVYVGDRLGVRIVADRGQWFVEVHPGVEDVDAARSMRYTKGWFNLEAWSACLAQPVLFHDPTPARTDREVSAVLENSWWLEPQLDYLREHFGEIEDSCSTNRIDATLMCLAEEERRLSPFRSSKTAAHRSADGRGCRLPGLREDNGR